MEQPLEVKQEGGPQIELQGKEIAKASEAPPPPTVEEMLKRADELGARMREVIVAAKKLPREKGVEPHLDAARSLSLAQMYLQTGYMWLRRAIEVPKVF